MFYPLNNQRIKWHVKEILALHTEIIESTIPNLGSGSFVLISIIMYQSISSSVNNIVNLLTKPNITSAN